MAEKVETGGNIRFEYPKGYRQSPITLEQQKEIEKGYAEYYKRKKREAWVKMSIWILIAILAIAGGIYWILNA